jgi:hypothetical protein
MCNRTLLFGSELLKHGGHLLLWSRTMLLPSNVHRKPITSICDVFTESFSYFFPIAS